MEQMSDSELAAKIQAAYDAGYAAAKRNFLLKASDAMNEIVGHAYRSHRDTLEAWANELGRPLHSAVPGQDIFPRNYEPPK